jgi:exodeoxyribonuclease VII small subunit
MQMKNNDTSAQNSEFRIPNSELSFEQAAARIDEIVKLLERGDAPLDKSLALFEEGAGLIKICGKMLDDAEQRVVRLQKGTDGEPEEVAFDDED